MANQEQVALLKQGGEQWNQWRKRHPGIRPNLSGANLEGTDLRYTDLSFTDLSGAHLSNADLRGTELQVAIFAGANLQRANLNNADLTEAQFNEADLRKAFLSFATLNRTRLENADLSGAILGSTVFVEMDLSKVRGLEAVEHEFSSSIDISTIYRSSKNIPEVFLRGIGIPDSMIAHIHSLAGKPTDYYSCFISYSNRDEALARRLYADLQTNSVRCWFAPEDMKIGDKIRPHIDEAIHLQDKLLLLLSEHSIASAWVEDEVEAAMEKENQQQREVLFPVSLDDTVIQTTQAWAARLRRSRHIGNFTNWTDPQAYQQAFERLLRDLKKIYE